MALDYMDDDELVYQAKAAAKNIVNAKYEVTQKVGDFLFLAHSEEEFYQRAQAIDSIINSTATRRLASVSDSKAKLTKALYQEWETKHASCDECARANFNYINKVAAPILPNETTTRQTGKSRTRKLWDKWPFIQKNKNGDGVIRRNLFEDKDEKGNLRINPANRDETKASIMDTFVGRSLGRLDDPEVYKQVVPGSVVWMDPHGLYGSDKKRIETRSPEEIPPPDANPKKNLPPIDPSHMTAMIGRVHGIKSLGHEGVLTTKYHCTGDSFRGFNANQSGDTFPPCTHTHHEGDGCGLTSAVAKDGTTQPGCGKPHVVVTAHTPQIFNERKADNTGSMLTPLPFIGGEKSVDKSSINPAEMQRRINEAKTPEQAESNYFTNESDEQSGEVPLDRMFLLHPRDSELFANVLDQAHKASGGEGRHPANTDIFTVGGKDYRTGDIVSLTEGDGSRNPGKTASDLGIVAGVTGHRNTEHLRFGKNYGYGPNTDNDSSRNASKPGEYSLVVHRVDAPKSGRLEPTVVDPETNQIAPSKILETTQHFPSSLVNVVQPFDAKKTSNVSKLYKTLKNVQKVFSAKPQSPRSVGRPKTVKTPKPTLDIGNLDLDSFGDLFK